MRAAKHYEDAIELAREHGQISSEALAHELAARFFAEQKLTTSAQAHLAQALGCYERWGALGPVRRLDPLRNARALSQGGAALDAAIQDLTWRLWSRCPKPSRVRSFPSD